MSRVEFTAQAEKDVFRLRGLREKALRAILQLRGEEHGSTKIVQTPYYVHGDWRKGHSTLSSPRGMPLENSIVSQTRVERTLRDAAGSRSTPADFA